MSTATPPPVRRYVSRALAVGFGVAAVCGVGGAFVAEDVVAGIGRLVNHDELALRLLGWCWGGLPFVVPVVAITQRHHLSRTAKRALAYVVAVWAASGALLLPGRHSSAEERFGAAYLDYRPLGFGWAAGFLSVFATFLAAAVLVLLWRLLTRTATKQSAGPLNSGLTILWILFTAGGLVAALLAPMP